MQRFNIGNAIYLLHEKIEANSENVKNKFTHVIKDCLSLSVSYAYKYKKYYELCLKYNKLKLITKFPTRDLFNNLNLLEEKIRKDEEFWNWGNTGISPTFSQMNI